MAYDKSQIHTLAENVINGRIDELSARESVPEELKKILEIEINKRLMARGYDRNNIQNTTDRGIPLLADDIVVGLVDKNKALNGIFKGYLPKLKEEIAKRREDEILWNEAVSSQEIEMFKKYLDTYDNHDSSYEGRYVARAKEYIRNIKDEEKEWLRAKNVNTKKVCIHDTATIPSTSPQKPKKNISKEISSILSSLIVFSNQRQLAETDNADWLKATSQNTIHSYKEYLRVYNDNPWGYIGKHVEEAKKKFLQSQEYLDWVQASKANNKSSYNSYIHKYEPLKYLLSSNHLEDAKNRLILMTSSPIMKWILKIKSKDYQK